MQNNSADPWNIGTLHKPAIWAFYILSNYSGVLLCGMLIYSVYRNDNRINTDIFVAGLASGCLTMSITCGTQCLVNVIAGRFYGGETACQIEAIAHVSAILTEFFCVSAISLCAYLRILKRDVSRRLAIQLVAVIWLVCCFVTGLASLVSPIYLMSAGTYCFFGFSSFAIAGWLVPGLILALGTMFFCHYKIMRWMKKNSSEVYVTVIRDGVTQQERITYRDIFWKDQFRMAHIIFMIVLLLGWGFAAVTAIYELCVGPALEWLVTAVGVGGVSFSWVMPLVYGLTSKHHKSMFIWWFGWMCIPIFGKQWWQTQRNQTKKRSHVVIAKRKKEANASHPSRASKNSQRQAQPCQQQQSVQPVQPVQPIQPIQSSHPCQQQPVQSSQPQPPIQQQLAPCQKPQLIQPVASPHVHEDVCVDLIPREEDDVVRPVTAANRMNLDRILITIENVDTSKIDVLSQPSSPSGSTISASPISFSCHSFSELIH